MNPPAGETSFQTWNQTWGAHDSISASASAFVSNSPTVTHRCGSGDRSTTHQPTSREPKSSTAARTRIISGQLGAFSQDFGYKRQDGQRHHLPKKVRFSSGGGNLNLIGGAYDRNPKGVSPARLWLRRRACFLPGERSRRGSTKAVRRLFADG
jgi:hypothetical protein